MSSSLVPERPLLISPTLAATIGLQETVMLHVISELLMQHPSIYRNQRRWAELDQSSLQKAMPFWSIKEIRKVQQSLLEKGLVQVMPVANQPDSGLFAINQVITENTTSPPKKQPAPSTNHIFKSSSSSGQLSLVPAHWQPSDDLYQQCQQLYNIPREFVEQRVKGFIINWRDRQKRQYSWHNTFLRYILKEWREDQSYKKGKELEANMSEQWQPNGDALSILEHAGINLSFIEDAVPEFVLYWRERGLVTSTWNSKFIAHIRRQWDIFNIATENDNIPRLLPADYEPSPACYEVIALANIDLSFAREQIKEFILFWRESNKIYPSWNTKFLQHVKYKWANQHQSSLPMSQQIESTIERFTDRSWAE